MAARTIKKAPKKEAPVARKTPARRAVGKPKAATSAVMLWAIEPRVTCGKLVPTAWNDLTKPATMIVAAPVVKSNVVTNKL